MVDNVVVAGVFSNRGRIFPDDRVNTIAIQRGFSNKLQPPLAEGGFGRARVGMARCF
jgi:hypothetical protein